MKTKIIAILLAIMALFVLAGCGGETQEPDISPAQSAEVSPEQSPEPEVPAITEDREGNPITLPASIDRIISMGPSNTEILTALGAGEKIVAADTYSENVEGISAGLPMFSMTEPDGEQIINLEPDVVFVTGMSKAGGSDLFKTVSDAGICIIYIPSSSSIDEIKEDIRYLAAVLGEETTGDAIIADMDSEIAAIRQKGESITDKKTVYFEISAAPYMYSLGTGTFLNEMIEIIGAVNILGDYESWISVSDEAVLDADPDVILTSVNYIEDPVAEICARPGWEGITAVENGDVYYIDTDSSNRPSHNIIRALKEMALAIYPEN